MINWKVRFKNKQFWVSFIPAILLLAQKIMGLFGYAIDLGGVGERVLEIVEVLFFVLALLGVVTDPTTEGVGDSQRALTYEYPSK